MTLSICMDYLFDEFQITCEMVHRYPGPRGFSWKFSLRKSERPTKRRLRWQRVAKRRGEKGFFFLSPHSFGTAICSFPGIGASNTNFHLVNQLVRYVPIFIVDTNVQQQPICLLSHGEKFFASAEQNDVVIRMDRCVQAVGEIHSRPLSLWWLWSCPSAWTIYKSAMHVRRSSEFDRQWGRNIVGP